MTDTTTNETIDYDLSSTGTIVELPTENLRTLGWNVSTDTAADFEVEIQGDGTKWYSLKSYSGRTDIDDGVVAPEAKQVRIKNTSTVSDTADALLGGTDT